MAFFWEFSPAPAWASRDLSSGDFGGLQGFSLPSCHRPKGNSCSRVPLQPLLLTIWLSHYLSYPSKTKQSSQNKGLLPNRFPLLHTYSRGADWLSLARGRARLESKGNISRSFLQGPAPAAPPHTVKSPPTQPNTLEQKQRSQCQGA